MKAKLSANDRNVLAEIDRIVGETMRKSRKRDKMVGDFAAIVFSDTIPALFRLKKLGLVRFMTRAVLTPLGKETLRATAPAEKVPKARRQHSRSRRVSCPMCWPYRCTMADL